MPPYVPAHGRPLCSAEPLSATESMTTQRPSTSISEQERRNEMVMAENVSTHPGSRHGCTSAQSSESRGLRKCYRSVAPSPLDDLRSLDAPLTVTLVMSELGWTASRAHYWLEKLKSKGDLVPTGKGCVWRAA